MSVIQVVLVKLSVYQQYGLNEEVTISTSYGDYALTITRIQETAERNQFSDKTYPQVFVIDYTYRNISSSDSVYISEMNFNIIDQNGEIGGTYPNSTSRNPEDLTVGVTCRAQMVLGVNNTSNNIKLQYFDNMFNSQPDVVFDINL